MQTTKFYNRMGFSIKMRKVWEPGSPPIELHSGDIVEGPYNILIQFKFLAPLPFEFHKVESNTQTQNFEFKTDAPQGLDVAEGHTAELPPVVADDGHTNEVAPKLPETAQTEDSDASGLPFDPKSVNWLQVKVVDLELACKKLGIDISALSNKKPKEKKWELVKLVKKAVGIVNN
jgi:hypothetical protein